MKSNLYEAQATGDRVDHNNIGVAIIEQAGGYHHFELTACGETLLLNNTRSLNRLTAMGLTPHHSLKVSVDGVAIDGRMIHYNDSHAAEELEELLNHQSEIDSTHSTQFQELNCKGQNIAPAISTKAAPFSADSIKVTSDGFEFHVSYVTKFGERRTENLEEALTSFQKMGALKPHVNIQKTGIQLTVTEWDGADFIKSPGIDDLAQTTPEQIEFILKSNIIGNFALGITEHKMCRANSSNPVVRVQLKRKPQNLRFTLLLHRADGTVEDGPMLIRANLEKLHKTGLFMPSVKVSMTVLSDVLIVERKTVSGGSPSLEIGRCPITTLDDAKRAEELLNQILAGDNLQAPPPPLTEHDSTSKLHHVSVPKTATSQLDVLEPTVEHVVISSTQSPANPEESNLSDICLPNTEPQLAPIIEPQEPQTSSPKDDTVERNWVATVLTHSSASPMNEIDPNILELLQVRFQREQRLNKYGFPSIPLTSQNVDGQSVDFELVSMPHYLLCNFSFGYIRFGPDTRVYLNRTDDFLLFPHNGLRGIITRGHGEFVVFVVSNDCADFLKKDNAKNYTKCFENIITTESQIHPDDDLVWPLTTEEKLFNQLTDFATDYGLHTSDNAILLDSSQGKFLGFKRAHPHGLEFRNGDDYAQFTPSGVEIEDDEFQFAFPHRIPLVGWVLDHEGTVCALYEPTEGFTPPMECGTVRFVTASDMEHAKESFTVMAYSK